MIKTAAKMAILEEAAPYITRTTPFEDILRENGYITEDDVDPLGHGDANDRAYEAMSQCDSLASALCKMYVYDVLGESAKNEITQLAYDIRDTFKEIIEENTWLEEESKEAIYLKLDQMDFNILEPSIGYCDYEGVNLISAEDGGTLFDNYLILKDYIRQERNKTIGQPANSSAAWFVYTPTMQNAFYDPDSNSFSIYPGLINSMFYRSDITREELAGAIGAIIAHETCHAFDKIGSQMNANGEYEIIFAGNDLEEYAALIDQLQEFYDGIIVMNDRHMDGNRVSAEAGAELLAAAVITRLGENIEGFDMGGSLKA